MIDKIKDIISNWRYSLDSYTAGGCETCGWGGTEAYEITDADMDKLNEEINNFCESFKESK